MRAVSGEAASREDVSFRVERETIDGWRYRPAEAPIYVGEAFEGAVADQLGSLRRDVA